MASRSNIGQLEIWEIKYLAALLLTADASVAEAGRRYGPVFQPVHEFCTNFRVPFILDVV
jgi:hypothetical protein